MTYVAEQVLETIQSKIAYLERANSELSDVVFRQDREIQTLVAKMTELSDRLASVVHDDSPQTVEERPPHY